MHDVEQALIGTSGCFLRAAGMIPLLSATRSTVLISGETGTGKELFARAIHYTGERRGKPFVPVNCAALPDHLIENELFGHNKGAFTGAFADKHGLFHEADGGTLFLDEINSLGLVVQSKLLRVLQDQEFRPLGSTKSHKVNVKVVAATNTDLRTLVEMRQFREDLFHRLNVLSVTIPPLRDRKEDILLLATHFLKVYTKEFALGPISMGPSCKSKLLGYSWPGNVRELEGAIQRAVAMTAGGVLESHDLDLPTCEPREAMAPVMETVPKAGMSYEGGFQKMKMKVIEEFERTYLCELLSVHHGNISKAARAAKKERRAFQRLLHKHGLDRRVFRAA
jgi:transcriptional regulator with GAF, ATPase, and Fis domain